MTLLVIDGAPHQCISVERVPDDERVDDDDGLEEIEFILPEQAAQALIGRESTTIQYLDSTGTWWQMTDARCLTPTLDMVPHKGFILKFRGTPIEEIPAKQARELMENIRPQVDDSVMRAADVPDLSDFDG